MTEEMYKRAMKANSKEELLKIAKEFHVELTEEQAEAYYKELNSPVEEPEIGELDDDALDDVSGGGSCANNRELRKEKKKKETQRIYDLSSPVCIYGDGVNRFRATWKSCTKQSCGECVHINIYRASSDPYDPRVAWAWCDIDR